MEMTFLLLVLQFFIVFKVTEGKTNSTITNTNSNSKVSKYTHYETHYFTEKMYSNYRFKFIVFFLNYKNRVYFQILGQCDSNGKCVCHCENCNPKCTACLSGWSGSTTNLCQKRIVYSLDTLYFKQQLCDKYIKVYIQNKTFHYKMTSFYFRERVFPPKCNG